MWLIKTFFFFYLHEIYNVISPQVLKRFTSIIAPYEIIYADITLFLALAMDTYSQS